MNKFLYAEGPVRSSIHLSSSEMSQQTNVAMADNARRLAVNLYTELLARLVKLINRSIRSAHKQQCNILIFDSPGFQNPSTIGNVNSDWPILLYNPICWFAKFYF